MAIDYKLWTTVKDGQNVTNTEDKYAADDIIVIERDAKAKNCLYCALGPSEFEKISACDTVKDIWDKLKVAYEGTNQVKETKINILTQEYESFNMKDDKTISDMFGRIQKIVSTLKNLGETMDEAKQVKKILRSLPRSWMPKVTVIQEAKDLDKMKVEELMGSLMTHEILIKQREKPHDEPKGKRAIALKVDTDEENNSNESDEDDEEDEIAMLFRRIKTITRRRRDNPSNFKEKRRYVPICYKCRKLGHMQNKCEEKKMENKKDSKKYQIYFERRDENKKFSKKKKALATWDVLEDIITSDANEKKKRSSILLK